MNIKQQQHVVDTAWTHVDDDLLDWIQSGQPQNGYDVSERFQGHLQDSLLAHGVRPADVAVEAQAIRDHTAAWTTDVAGL